ncbi:hypothetical protein UlMin_035718 [Ulmus minor]
MYRMERSLRENRYKHEKENPSFSSTLLDKIYRSIDEGERNCEDLKLYKEKMAKKPSKYGGRSSNKAMEVDGEMASFRRVCLIEKWMEKKAGEKAGIQRRNFYSEFDRKFDYNDQDVLFFSSTSSSSDSSSGGFSSSDTESMFGARSAASYFPVTRPKPIWTNFAAKPEKTEKKQKALFYKQREFQMLDDYHCSLIKEQSPKLHDEALIKFKSRALKIYSNLKKVKQPISPGGRLANFLNSIFAIGNGKKSKLNSSSIDASFKDSRADRKSNSVQASTCSSASSHTRSCLSKNSPSTREKLRNGVKRSVRFYPASVIVDEHCRPCGKKSLYEEEDSALMEVSVLEAWKIGRSPARKAEERKLQELEKTRKVEEAARDFLRDYRQNQVKNDLITRNHHQENKVDDDDDDDDAGSYSSSDLFELDHLAVLGQERYREELPVYETTRVNKNRVICNGLIM